ncbi:MAG: C4-dicarboxylate ABC transporter permease [Geminicoccaceae bacterium]|nr:MAG: C4-dicarboxylate ABC transporter permease [Geminicoccaceae bacterium]
MNERELVGLAALFVLFLLLLLRLPVAVAMLLTGIGGSWVLSLVAPFLRFEPYLRQFKTLFWNTVASYDLSVVPLFILMGYLASHGGLARDLFAGIQALVGRRRGGVAMAAIGACAGFGAVCGSSLATASTMGRVALPELARLGYHPRLSTGTLAAGGTLGILIPPSVPLVIYAIVVEASILEMFQAAIVPGLLAVLFFLAVIALQVRRDPSLAPAVVGMEPAERRAALLRLLPVLLLFGAIILGLGIGLFTPTPAAGVGVCLILLYGLLLRALGRGGIGRVEIGRAVLDTAVTSSMIYLILFAAEVLKGFFARTGLPAAIASWAAASGLDPWLVLVAMLLLLVVLGCFLESLSMVVVVLPFFWPVLVELNGGEDVVAASAAYGLGNEELKIWFGILALVVVELGLVTPPVGLNLFIIGSLAPNVPMRETVRGVLPFLASEGIRILLLLAFPLLTLGLPRLLGR